MRVADYIVQKLENFGVTNAFMITGGGAMHLNDAFGRSEKIAVTTPHHEQAVAIAAEGYSRASGKLGVSVVTSGPGGTNTLTGVMGQYMDSIPALYISGQVKWETHKCAYPEVELRQLGDQELDIISVVKSITKYTTVLTDPNQVDVVLEKALREANSGRPGPVWIDVPLNVQASLIDADKIEKFSEDSSGEFEKFKGNAVEGAGNLLALLAKAERPVLVAGNGVRVANARKAFNELANRLQIPVVTTFNGSDNIPTDNPYYCGRIGSVGDRAGNFAVQNSDLYISLGSRNNVRQISYSWQSYVREAKKVCVDIDAAELNKPTIQGDLKIHCDVGQFISALNERLKTEETPDFSDWNKWCQVRKEKYDTVLPEYYEVKDGLHPYVFIRRMTELSEDDATIVAGNGTACVAMFHASIVKEGQTHFWNSGCASMGYDLPASIGAAIAKGGNVLCLAGDGSIMMNLQELVTVAHCKLPIKIFVLENNGYQSIRQTQRSYFGLPFVGCGPESGVGFPDFVKLGQAIGLESTRIGSIEEMDEKLPEILANKTDPMLIEVTLNKDYIFAPKLSSRKLPDGRMVSEPSENMFPFLPREEFLENMIIKPINNEEN